MLEKLRNEPALVVGVLQAVLALAVSFGLDLSADQVGGIMAVSAAVLAVLVRSRVTPTRTIASRAED